MAIYIKGMELPTSCHSCPFENGGDCYGGKAKYIMDVDDEEELFRNSRHPNCPLIYIPEPHGRLVDGDRVVSNIPSDEAPFCKYLIAKAVLSVPTVIEGSE